MKTIRTVEKAETTRVDCHSCKTAVMLCGRNGTSISYVENCPFCGSDNIKVENCIMTPENDTPFYPEYGGE